MLQIINQRTPVQILDSGMVQLLLFGDGPLTPSGLDRKVSSPYNYKKHTSHIWGIFWQQVQSEG
ncbi:MAG TPA: hypothetical protein VK206_12480 [Anaerolineales bacterium]|nr:hypothetical protein [Anaerolineales bacterium]